MRQENGAMCCGQEVRPPHKGAFQHAERGGSQTRKDGSLGLALEGQMEAPPDP